MSWVLNCLMEETIILNALLMKDNHLNETSLPDPGASQNMTIKYLSVGQMSRFIYQQIALDVLFQMRYNSLPNSNKQPNDSLKAETPPVFSHLKHCFAYCFAQWCPPGVCRHPSSFWSVTLQPLGADQSTIPHMKGDLHSFHMRYISMLCSRRLQRFWLWNSLSESSLVYLPVSSLYLIAATSAHKSAQ